MRKIFVLFLLIHFLIAILSHALAQSPADTIRPGKGQLMTGVLKPGLRQYLVYFQEPAKTRELGFWFWMRDIAIETRHGVKTFVITQHWYGSDTAWYRTVYSLNTADNFAPVYHSETVHGRTRAFNWNAGGITGADTIADNTRKGFYLKFQDPNLNWNLDIETFEMLPLAAGKSFLINFYDAGLDPPKYVLYTVKGSEEVELMNGEHMDCWKLVTEGADPKAGAYSETYWISKATHEFLKEEDSYNGVYRYKIKLPGTAPDLLKRFRQGQG